MATNGEMIKNALIKSGKFEIIREINEGYNAFAFHAKNIPLNRYEFLKLYYFDDTFASDLLREPQLLVKTTKCKNIVEVYDVNFLDVVDDKYLCCQMEYVEGNSLLHYISERLIGQQDAVRLTCDILNGLSHLHRHHLLHRDIKPANVLYNKGSPKITDFGSAAMLSEGMSFVRASKHSPLYVPPEGWESSPKYCIKSDIYQVGMVLYELINGPLVIEGRHYLTKKVLSNLKRKGISYSALHPCDKGKAESNGIEELSRKGLLLSHGRLPALYLAKNLKKIITRSVNPDINKRYHSADEFMLELSKILVPNWIILPDGSYNTTNWKSYDWRVKFNRKGTPFIEKALTGTVNYRKVNTFHFENLVQLFECIEKL